MKWKGNLLMIIIFIFPNALYILFNDWYSSISCLFNTVLTLFLFNIIWGVFLHLVSFLYDTRKIVEG